MGVRGKGRGTRRDSRIWAVQDALFDMVRGSAAQVAEKVGCSKSTAYKHLNALKADGLVEWSRLFLPGRQGYVGYPRCYEFTKKGREVIGLIRTLRDEVRYLVSSPLEITYPETFEGIRELITTGYSQVGASDA